MLNSYGWSDALQHEFAVHSAPGLAPARMIVQRRGLYLLATASGEATASLSGRFAHGAAAGDYPVAGDWVAAALRPQEASATIHRPHTARKDDPAARARARKVWVQRTRRCRAHKRQRLEDD